MLTNCIYAQETEFGQNTKEIEQTEIQPLQQGFSPDVSVSLGTCLPVLHRATIPLAPSSPLKLFFLYPTALLFLRALVIQVFSTVHLVIIYSTINPCNMAASICQGATR